MEMLRLGAARSADQAPRVPARADFAGAAQRLIAAVKAMAQVKVVRRWRPYRRGAGRAGPPPQSRRPPVGDEARVRVVAIATSTGGPAALQRLLVRPAGRDLPLPILVVQHITPGFTAGLASWLTAGAALRVKVAEAGRTAAPAALSTLAPDDLPPRASISGAAPLPSRTRRRSAGSGPRARSCSSRPHGRYGAFGPGRDPDGHGRGRRGGPAAPIRQAGGRSSPRTRPPRSSSGCPAPRSPRGWPRWSCRSTRSRPRLWASRSDLIEAVVRPQSAQEDVSMPRVLIVEDSPTQAQRFALILEDAGFDDRDRCPTPSGRGSASSGTVRPRAQRPAPARRQRLRPLPADQGRPPAAPRSRSSSAPARPTR